MAKRRMRVQLLGVALLVAAGAWFYSASRREPPPVTPPATLGEAPALPTPGTGAPTGGAPAADSVTVAGISWPVADYTGIGLPSAPLDLRGCFRFEGALPQGPAATGPMPPDGPTWFDCFDGPGIAADLAAGRATAILAAPAEMPGADRMIAVYPDGRAFQWRQQAAE